MMPTLKSPFRLWMQASTEHPEDVEARSARYLELMREHGHIVPADHPEAAPEWDQKEAHQRLIDEEHCDECWEAWVNGDAPPHPLPHEKGGPAR